MQSNWTHRQIGKDKISARQRSKADSAGLSSFQIRYTAPDPTIRDVEGRLGQTRREATVRATDIEAALDEAQRLHADQAGHPITGAAGQTLGQFLAEWIVYRDGQATERFADEGKTGMTAKKGRPTLRTVDGDREALQRLLRCRLVKTPLAMVDESTLDAVEVELASRYSGRTIKNTWAVLAKALAQAVKWKRITRNPAQTTDAPEVARNRKVRHYTLEEMLALQQACATSSDPHPVLPAYVAVAFMTGARPEELLALQWPDIDFAAGEFRVTKVLARSQKLGHYVRIGAKTEDSETYVLVPQFALEALRSLYSDYLLLKQTHGLGWNPDQAVFWAPPGCNFGKRWTQDGLYHAISHRAKRARLPWFGAYGFRHGCATYLLEQGEDIHVVKETLRHSTITLTSDTYAARTRKITGRARAAFDRAETGAVIKMPERKAK